MSNQTITRNLPAANYIEQLIDLSGSNNPVAVMMATLTALMLKAAKVKNIAATVGTSVVPLTLPTGTYAVTIFVNAGATAVVNYAVGADTPALGTSDFAAGGAVPLSQGITLSVPEGQTTLKLLSSVASTTVIVTAFVL